ncbi:MAG TPA: DUF1559 domain-containing protein [Gemmataceae bacterium]|jgi:hypothetical protein|nr:DUF1559 domain-containing protein [Gemmataceae bacterium]
MKALFSSALIAATVAFTFAAPAAKEKVAPLGPVTEEQLEKSKKNLRHVALAWHNYNDTTGTFPNNVQSKDGKALLSWRVQILPYIEEEKLYEQFKLDEPWDSANNKKLIDKMPKLFEPIRARADSGMTFYQVFTGKHGLIGAGKQYGVATIPDGSSNTLMCVEAAKPVIWTEPDDLVFDGKDVPALGGLFDGKWHGAMCDGSVQRFRKGVDAELMARLIDPADGQVVNIEEAIDPDEEKK